MTAALRTQDLSLTGPYLRQTREAKGISQKDVAAYIGHTQGFVANVEAGRSHPSLQSLSRWLRALNLAVMVYDLEETMP